MPEPPERIGPMRSAAWLLAAASLPIWSCSVWGLPCLRHYCRSGALLPHLFTLTIAWSSLLDEFRAMAVCFLWHWPSMRLDAHVPDVIRHTALWSSDFPLPDPCSRKDPAATARSSCQILVYREKASRTLAQTCSHATLEVSNRSGFSPVDRIQKWANGYANWSWRLPQPRHRCAKFPGDSSSGDSRR